MLLRHFTTAVSEQPAENTFEAVDERTGALQCTCVIYTQMCEEMFPNRPLRVYLEFEGQSIPDGLLGAAVARAKGIAKAQKVPARLYTRIEPGNETDLESLKIFGLIDNDGLLCMKHTGAYDSGMDAPIGSVAVSDMLTDPLERRFFLERYNSFYGDSMDFDGLDKWTEADYFSRILIVSEYGMIGEVIVKGVEGIGHIAWLFVAKKWRRHGISKVLVELACDSLVQAGYSDIEADVHARIPYLLRTMEHCGFKQDHIIFRFPGIDIG